MKLDSSNITSFYNEIYDNVCRYAYENARELKVIQEVDAKWFGEIFLVSEMNETLHLDIVHYMKQEGILNRVLETCDKYIILPDAFSLDNFPKSNRNLNEKDENGIRDYGQPNIVILNGHIFEIISDRIGGVMFNYNGKLFYFYKSDSQYAPLLESDTPNMHVIDTIKYSDFSTNGKYPVELEIKDSFLLHLDLNNKVLYNNTTDDYFTLRVNFPFIRMDYDSKQIVEESTIKGLYSLQKEDVQIQEKLAEDMENKFIIHNRNMSFTNTAILIFKDRSYKIINTPVDDNFNIVDKHSIEFYRNDDIKEIIVFYKPVLITPGVERVDSLYDKVMSVSTHGFYDLKSFRKNTTELYEWLIQNHPSLDDIIEYGYKFDLDVLKAIQLSFPMHLIIRPNDFYVSTVSPNGLKHSSHPQLFLNVQNNLSMNPILFKDFELFDEEITTYELSNGMNVIHMNIKNFDSESFNELRSGKPIEEIETNIRNLLAKHRIEVYFLPNIVLDDGSIIYPKEVKNNIGNLPATVMSNSELNNLGYSTFFIDKRACMTSGSEPIMLKSKPMFTIGGPKASVVYFLKEGARNLIKLNHMNKAEKLSFSDSVNGILKRVDVFSSDAFMAFTPDGKLASNVLDFISNDYVVFRTTMKSYPGNNISLRYIHLSRINELHGIDLEIDYNKVEPTNAGSYNEEVIRRNPDILKLFEIGRDFSSTDYDFTLIDESTIENEIDTLRSYSSVGLDPYNVEEYKTFLSDQNITCVNHDTLIPTITNMNFKLTESLASNLLVANIRLGAGFNKDSRLFDELRHYTKNGVVLNSRINTLLLENDLNRDVI